MVFVSEFSGCVFIGVITFESVAVAGFEFVDALCVGDDFGAVLAGVATVFVAVF